MPRRERPRGERGALVLGNELKDVADLFGRLAF